VAQLSGSSLTWYTWFEQGRDVSVSPSALVRIADAFIYISHCRQFRGADLRCSCNACPDSRQVVFLYPSGQSSKAQSETYAT
jgi:hypothetical protein